MQNKVVYKNLLSILKIKGIYILTFLGILISIISTLIPYISGIFVNSIVSKHSIIMNLCLLSSCSLLFVYLRKKYAYFIAEVARVKYLHLQERYLQKVNSLSPFDLKKFRNGELGMKFFRDIQNVTDILRHFYPQLLEIFCGIIFALTFVFYSNWIMGIVFIFALPVNLLFIYPYLKIFNRVNSLLRNVTDSGFSRVFEIFHSLPFLKSISAEEYYQKESKAKFATIAKISYKNSIYEADFNFIIAFLLVIGEFLVLSISAYLAYKNIIKVGNLIFYQLLFTSTFTSFSNIYKLLPSWALIKESLTSLNELDVLKSEKQVLSDFNFNGNVELRNVSFSYNLKSIPILKNFSLNISKGDFISIEGVNGSGKSTLLKILCGYLHPCCGKVFFDGVSIDNVNLNSLRKTISIVNQEFLLISDSIKNNITLHNSKITSQEINDIVELVGLQNLVKNLPKGIDEIVGCNGKKLSGGEIQKIAIARALVRKPRLLIFDEVTNHLDIESQKLILNIITSLKGKVTMLFVSHSNQINLGFDKIIRLNLNNYNIYNKKN